MPRLLLSREASAYSVLDYEKMQVIFKMLFEVYASKTIVSI